MSASSKSLIIIIAVAAFLVGAYLNSAKVEDEFEVASLLSAQLLVADGDTQKEVAVDSYIGELTLVNFWASWCAPCRHEMPAFEAMFRQHNAAGFGVIGIAIDNQENAQPMLDSMDITYPIMYAEQTGMQLMSNTGNPNGLLPFSLLLDKNGKVLDLITFLCLVLNE